MSEKLVKDILEELQEINSKLDMIMGSREIMYLTADLMEMINDMKGESLTTSISQISGKLDTTYSTACDIRKKLQHKKY